MKGGKVQGENIQLIFSYSYLRGIITEPQANNRVQIIFLAFSTKSACLTTNFV